MRSRKNDCRRLTVALDALAEIAYIPEFTSAEFRTLCSACIALDRVLDVLASDYSALAHYDKCQSCAMCQEDE